MHRLDRSTIDPPTCLDEYDYRTQYWNELQSCCRKQVHRALFELQDTEVHGLRCAYCEGAIRHEGHIEHFRRKNRDHYPHLTFVWSNLFFACGSRNHCGHYKDRKSAKPYDPDRLIKPDEHDPEHYLYFHSTGEVRVREGLNADDRQRAEETIRIFGLDDPTLAGKRRRAVEKHRQKMIEEEVLQELATWEEAERRQYFLDEIKATRWEPYATTIKHFLEKDPMSALGYP